MKDALSSGLPDQPAECPGCPSRGRDQSKWVRVSAFVSFHGQSEHHNYLQPYDESIDVYFKRSRAGKALRHVIRCLVSPTMVVYVFSHRYKPYQLLPAWEQTVSIFDHGPSTRPSLDFSCCIEDHAVQPARLSSFRGIVGAPDERGCKAGPTPSAIFRCPLKLRKARMPRGPKFFRSVLESSCLSRAPTGAS